MDLNNVQGLLDNLNIAELEQYNNHAKKINNDSLIAQGSFNNALENYQRTIALYEQKYGTKIDDTNLAKEIETEVKLLELQGEVLRKKVTAVSNGEYERESVSIVLEENKEKLDANGQLREDYLDEQEQLYRKKFDERAAELNLVANGGLNVPQVPTEETTSVPVAQPLQQQPIAQPPVQQPVAQPLQQQPVAQPVQQPVAQQQPMQQQPMQQQPMQPNTGTFGQPAYNQPMQQQPIANSPVIDYNAIQGQLSQQAQVVAQEEVLVAQQYAQPQPPVQQQPIQGTLPPQPNGVAQPVNPNFNWGTGTQQQQVQQNVDNKFSSLTQGTQYT